MTKVSDFEMFLSGLLFIILIYLKKLKTLTEHFLAFTQKIFCSFCGTAVETTTLPVRSAYFTEVKGVVVVVISYISYFSRSCAVFSELDEAILLLVFDPTYYFSNVFVDYPMVVIFLHMLFERVCK